jgi:uncharacterized protein
VIETAFWDTSALVPLCIQQQSSSLAGRLTSQYDIAVWWGTGVEARSALARDLRNGTISLAEHRRAILRLGKMRQDWREIAPDEDLRSFAEDLPDRFPLRAADALQLAAAYMWTLQNPRGRPFISGDRRLLDAAEQLGFRTIAV